MGVRVEPHARRPGSAVPSGSSVPSDDVERARLLLVWLQARRSVDDCLSGLLAAGPAGEQRVRACLDRVRTLEAEAQRAFESYVIAAGERAPAAAPSPAQRGWGPRLVR